MDVAVSGAAENGRNMMIKQEKLEKIEAFKKDILAVCAKHGLALEPYYIQYDEYDSETGLNVVLSPVNFADPTRSDSDYHILSAFMDDYELRRWK